jgi:UDP-glucose 4-epimerase
MRALVTGGAGYIGSHAVARLTEAGHEPIVLDNLSEGHREAVGECEFVRADLADEEGILAVLEQQEPDVVMHFAASAYVGESVERPEKYYFNNVVNTLRLLRAMRGAGIERFVFSSSCSVYGSPARTPITEDCPFQPISPYGRTKAITEQILEDYSVAYGLRYASLRYFNAAGAMPDGSLGEDHRRETHLIPLVLRAALGKQKSIVIYGTDYPTPDGTCVRDYVHVLDLADAHVRAMEALQTGTSVVYNLGTGRGHSVKEVIETAQEVSGREIPTELGARRAGDPPSLVASPEMIRAGLGWEPAYPSLRKIIETAWNWHSAHPDGFDSAD